MGIASKHSRGDEVLRRVRDVGEDSGYKSESKRTPHDLDLD